MNLKEIKTTLTADLEDKFRAKPWETLGAVLLGLFMTLALVALLVTIVGAAAMAGGC